MPFLTPDAPPDEFVCRTIKIPKDSIWLSLISGALSSLIFESAWEKFGTLTPREAADAFTNIFLEYTRSNCVGRAGEIFFWPSDIQDPPEALELNGQTVRIGDYPELFTAWYGELSPEYMDAEIPLPNYASRAVVVAGTVEGLTSHYPGEFFGDEQVELTEMTMPNHTHYIPPPDMIDPGHAHGAISGTNTVVNGGLEAPAASATLFPSTTSFGTTGITFASTTSGDAGGGAPHDNIPPSVALRAFVKTK